MRLSILNNGHSFIQRSVMCVIGTFTGFVPPPIKIMSYRRGLFGLNFSQYLHRSMRGSKEWTLGEVELFAAFVSKQNNCEY